MSESECSRCGAERVHGFDLCPHCGHDHSLENPSNAARRVFAGRYRELTVVGQGGMGAVYEVQDSRSGERLALKLLHCLSPAGRARLRREAEAMQRVHHENVVQLVEVGVDNEQEPYLAMELMRGRTLRQRFQADEVFEERRIRRILAQVLAALEAAHAVGVIHRDLTPGNVIVDDDDRVKVCDFGIAKLVDATVLTRTGVTLGTIGHMSPEQIRGEPIDDRADLYSVGVLLYRMLTGRMPFDSASRAIVLFQQARTMPMSPAQVRPGVPSDLDTLCMQALSTAPADRPASAPVMREALNAG